jgi:hypothetical protein
LQRALSLAERVDDASGIANATYHLGLCAKVEGDANAARRHFARALVEYRGLFGEAHPKVAMVSTDLADILLQQQRPREALGLLRAVTNDSRNERDQAHTKFLLAVALWRTGERSSAIKLAKDTLQTLRGLTGVDVQLNMVRTWLQEPH